MAITISGTNGIVGAGFTVDNSGVSVTAGVGTFGTLAAPAAGLTGALPALSAASLTSIPAANIVGVATAGFGNASGAFSQGTTEADQWRLTTQYSGSADITSNLERGDSTGFGYKGTGMTESSGVFTFPSTGVWLVSLAAEFKLDADSDRSVRVLMKVTTNNSSYSEVIYPSTNIYQSSANTYGTVYGQQLIDCTDTSQVKVKFATSVVNNPTITRGSSTINYTYFTFIRLGDT